MSGKIAFLSNRFRDALSLNFPQAAGLLTQVVTLPIVLANLPVADYGLYQFVLALEVWLTIFTVPQISLGAKRGIARGLDGTLLFSYLVRLRLFLILALLVWIVAFILLRLGGYETLSVILFMFGAFLPLGVLTQATWRQFLLAKKKFRQYALWRGITLVFTPIAGMITAIQTHDIILFTGVQLGLSVVLSVTALTYVVAKNRLIQAYKEGTIDKEVVPYGIRLLPASFAVSASEKGAALIIGPLFGFANLAIFSVAEKLTSLFKAFLNSSYHLVYADFAKLSWDTLVERVRRHFLTGLLIAFLISIPFVAVGYFYINFFLPDSYQTAKLYLLIFGLGLPPLVLRGVMQAVLESNFKSREILLVAILPNIVRLFLFLIFGWLFGLFGIVWMVVVSEWLEYVFYHLVVLQPHRVSFLLKAMALFRL